MARRMSKKRDDTRQWLSGLAITLTTIVGLFAFWRISPGVTWIVALMSLIGLVIAFWVAGKKG